MSRSKDTELAIRLRFAQWEMSEAAHHLPAGRFSHSDGEALANTLELIVKALRDHPYTILGEIGRDDDDNAPTFLSSKNATGEMVTTEPMVNVVRESVEMACYPGSQVYVSDSVVYDEESQQRFEVRIVTIKRPYSDG